MSLLFVITVEITAALTMDLSLLPPFFPLYRRAINKCEVLVKDLYSKLGLQYRESSSEDEDSASKPTEVIEIPDEDDDDVMSVDSGWKCSSVFPMAVGFVGREM